MSENISRRDFIQRARDMFAYGMLRKMPGTEFFLAATAGVTVDASLKTLINEANAQEPKVEYIKPREWTRLTMETANFSEDVFPKKLEFAPGKKTVIVSAVWQTAALYDPEGNLVGYEDRREMRFLASTGMAENPTNLGVYQVQTNNDEKYESHEFTYRDAKGVEHNAPMPFAKHLGKGKIDSKGNLVFMPHTGVAMHARRNVQDDTSTSFMSHGCIGIPYAMAENFHKNINIDDHVIVVGERMPKDVKSLKDMVIKLEEENSDYLKYMKEEVNLSTEEKKDKQKCRFYCTANGKEIYNFMSKNKDLNPYRENDGKTPRIPATGAECNAVMKLYYDRAYKKCQTTP